MSGEITNEWIKHNLTHNPNYIMSQLPESLRQMIENGTMPDDLEADILSGDFTPIEIRNKMNASEEFFRVILPEKMVKAIGVNF